MLLLALAHAEPLLVPAYELEFVHHAAPAWPEEDRRGTRTCSADIDFGVDGEVIGVEVRGLGCPDSYAAAAEEAMWTWQIEPYLVEGVAAEVRVVANLTFEPAPPSPRERPDPPPPETWSWWRTGTTPPDEIPEGETAFDWAVVVKWPAVAPAYPAAARKRGAKGTCVMRLYVDSDGRPYGAVVEDCPDVFVESSLAAARRWRLEPLVVDGLPRRSTVLVRIDYAPG